MKVTVLEVRQRQFQTVMRGYDRAEVNTFLAEVADDFEHLALENDKLKHEVERAKQEAERLKQDAAKIETALTDHSRHEKTLTNALVSAQRLADDIKEKAQQDAQRVMSDAEKEGQRVIADAEARAAILVENSHTRLDEIQREIENLRTKRRDVEASLQGIISALQMSIDTIRAQETSSVPSGPSGPSGPSAPPRDGKTPSAPWTPAAAATKKVRDEAETLT